MAAPLFWTPGPLIEMCEWVGIDASKAHRCWVAIDNTGTTVWSRKVSNDEALILSGLSEVLALAGEVRWAVDLTGTAPARRRVDVLWALLRDNRLFTTTPPARAIAPAEG
nr:transposase [Streptomyces sp. TLI_55]